MRTGVDVLRTLGEGVDGQGEDDNRIADHTMPYSAGQQLHKCYIAHRSVPIAHTEGTFTFFYGQDYTDGGWYSLRYFAGESGGTVCEVHVPLSTLEEV